jgi:hypothetical protein
MTFDIVILVGPNDIGTIEKQLEYTRQNVIGYRKIFLLCYDKTISINGCQMIYENIFPFHIGFVTEYFGRHYGKNNRNGWYYQQLLKFYVGILVPEILDQYLILDADVYLYKPTEFIAGGRAIFNLTDSSYHEPYFTHMNRLHSSLQKRVKSSGISHHMLFSKIYVKELMKLVEEHHNKPFWKAFIECVTEHSRHAPQAIESGASEYEIYMSFMIHYHPENILFRKLKWEDKPHDYNIETQTDLDYISVCHWM